METLLQSARVGAIPIQKQAFNPALDLASAAADDVRPPLLTL